MKITEDFITTFITANKDKIIDRMIAVINAEAGGKAMIDTREGSLIRTAIAPIAVELAQAYISLAEVIEQSFIDSATRPFILRRAAERSIFPYPATAAVWKAQMNTALPADARFTIGRLTFYVSRDLGGNQYEVTCEQIGIVGNSISSMTLVPIGHIAGLTSAQIVGSSPVAFGTEEEPDESIIRRYKATFVQEYFGGNLADYRNKLATLTQFIGAVKVQPVWDGGGTVRIVFLTPELTIPSADTIKEVQHIIDPIDGSTDWREPHEQSLGYGWAPIGHKVTVQGAEYQDINMTLKMNWKSPNDNTNSQIWLKDEITAFFTEKREIWDNKKIDNYLTGIPLSMGELQIKFNNSERTVFLETAAFEGQPFFETKPFSIPRLGVLTLL